MFLAKDHFEQLPSDVAQELETRLIGNWAMMTDQGMMLVKFGKTSMSVSTFKIEKIKTKEVSVIYKKLDDSWGIELLSMFGQVEGQMMVIYEDEGTILYGAPGLPFVKLYRETKTDREL